MRKALRTELWKATHNPYFYLAIGLGFAIALGDMVQNAMLTQQYTERLLEGLEAGYLSGAHDGFSLFTRVFPYCPGRNYATVLYMIAWPILAAMPYAWSYSDDRKSGMYNQIVSRTGAGQYITAKYLAVFLSGGLVVSFTTLAELLLSALVSPYAMLSPGGVSGVNSDRFLAGLFYTNPWAHALIWCGVVFFLGGAAAGLAFLVGTRVKLRVLVILSPFAMLYVWHMFYYFVLNMYFYEYLPLTLSPQDLIQVIGGNGNSELHIALMIGFLTALGLGAGFWQVKGHELV